MVLDHVADRAGGVVVGAPAAGHPTSSATVICTRRRAGGPDRLEERVAEPQGQDVLDGLLAQVMVDPVDLVLLEDPRDVAVQRPGDARSWPNGFSMMTRLQPVPSPF